MKSIALILTISVISLLSASTIQPIPIGTAKKNLVPTIEASTRKFQTYKISLENLEKQLHNLTRVAKVEDEWIYIIEDQMLHDIGSNNQAHSVSRDLTMFDSGKASMKGKNVLVIHIHAWEEHSSRDFLPTSTPDLHNQAGHSDMFTQKHGAKTVRSIVYDGHGVWESVLSPELHRQLGACDTPQQEQAMDMIDRCKEKIHSDSPSEREAVVKRYIEKVKKLGLYMTYKPLN